MAISSNPKLTKEEALAFKRRWQLVNEMEKRELRRTPPSKKFEQLAALMASVSAFGWHKALAEEDERVWKRWKKLREHYEKAK